MKWKNKGHEYDAVYENMSQKHKLLLFGAGDYGRQFFNSFCSEFEIIGYIDNSIAKQGSMINGIPCFSLENVSLEDDTAIIVTMSQIARVNPIIQLNDLGYRKNRDFYIIEEFISIYYVYKYSKVYFSSISFLPSTACNLNCKYCLNFNPFSKKYYVREWNELIKDVDLFFSCIDYIMLFHVSGGEPFLYPHIAELIDYLDKQYGDRIGTIRTVTNGTVIPNDEVLIKLSKCNFELTVDDYREAVPQYNERFDQLLLKLNEYGIRYYVNKVDSWIDLAPETTDYSECSEEQMIAHRNNCSQSWQELRDGKLFNCNYASYAIVAGIIGKQDEDEIYDLNLFDNNKKKEIVEFRLGFTEKGYTNFCRRCKGFTPDNVESVEPAIQI